MRRGTAIRLTALGLLAALVLRPDLFAPLFAPFAPEGGPVIYDRTPLLALALGHLGLVAIACGLATVLAVSLAVLVTRPGGAEFQPLSRAITNIGQTFPPVAVLALTVPVLGFGSGPTLVALFLYGLLPIFENSLTALSTTPPKVLEAARGMGLTRHQRLLRVELPLAAPVILTGIRLSAVISLGTATIGSTVAARTLGEVIISGLLTNNTAFVLQGGLIVGLFAGLLHDGFLLLEARLARRTGRTAPAM